MMSGPVYLEIVEVPTSVLSPRPAQRVVTETTPNVDVLLPNTSALRRAPPAVGTYIDLLGQFLPPPPSQRALWDARAVRATQGLLHRRGLVDCSAELVHYAVAKLAARHGRIMEPLARLPFQPMPMDAPDYYTPNFCTSASQVASGPTGVSLCVPQGAFVPPVVVTRDRLLFDPRLVPLIPQPVLMAGLFHRALDLFFRATERLEAVRRGNLSIGGKPVRADVMLVTIAAQSQDMMAQLDVPQTFGGVYGFTDANGDTMLLSFALDPELAADVSWRENFASAYARLFERLPGFEQEQSSSQGSGTSELQASHQSQAAPEPQHGSEPEHEPEPSSASASAPSSASQANPSAPQPHVMDQQSADELFGPGPSPGSDMTLSDAEREQVASDLSSKFPGTEAAAELRKLVKRPPPPPPTLGTVLRRWAEAQVTSSSEDQRSPFRFSQPVWRRYGFWEPARAMPTLGDVAVVIDTSGSVGKAELEKLAGAVQELCTVGLPSTLRVIACDTKVHEVATLPRHRLAELAYTGESWVDLLGPYRARVRGGGGTDMRTAIAAALKPPVETNDEPGGDPELRTDPDTWSPPALVLVLTDGWTPWPDEPPVPVVVGTTDRPGPAWAESVRI